MTDVETDTYLIEAVIGGNYFVGSGVGAMVVYDPSLGFITGGGWFDTAYGRINFGFNAKYLRSGQAQGSLLVILRRPEGNYILKSNSLGTLTVTKSSDGWYYATLQGKATYQVPTSTGLLACGAYKCGNYSFTMYVEDLKEPGAGMDRFWIQVTPPAGGTAVQTGLSMPTTPSVNAKVIQGGNIQIPQPQGSTK